MVENISLFETFCFKILIIIFKNLHKKLFGHYALMHYLFLKIKTCKKLTHCSTVARRFFKTISLCISIPNLKPLCTDKQLSLLLEFSVYCSSNDSENCKSTNTS